MAQKFTPLTKDQFMATNKFADMFDSRPCPRCGGCGEYSYCQQWGTMCFKCQGYGKLLTARGVRQQSAYMEMRMINLRDTAAAIGKRVKFAGMQINIDEIKFDIDQNKYNVCIIKSQAGNVYEQTQQPNGDPYQPFIVESIIDKETRWAHYQIAAKIK